MVEMFKTPAKKRAYSRAYQGLKRVVLRQIREDYRQMPVEELLAKVGYPMEV
jgi:hypothetical protein